MIGEQKYNEEIEATAFRQSQEIYNPPKSESQKLNDEKIAIRKRLAEIEARENAVDPQIIEMKKKQLHEAIIRHHRDQELSNRQVQMQFEQMTSPEGFTFKK